MNLLSYNRSTKVFFRERLDWQRFPVKISIDILKNRKNQPKNKASFQKVKLNNNERFRFLPLKNGYFFSSFHLTPKLFCQMIYILLFSLARSNVPLSPVFFVDAELTTEPGRTRSVASSSLVVRREQRSFMYSTHMHKHIAA